MNREIILPTDEQHWLQLRAQDITSTDIAALFGISPYMTEFELWHRKKNASIVQLEQNDRMTWGTRLQDAIANGIAKDYALKIRKMTEYIRDPAFRIGSSFDFEFTTTNDDGEDEVGILEVKNVDSLAYKDGWIIDGDSVEAPPHIEIQVQHQLLVSGHDHALIGALIGGNRVTLIKRTSDKEICEAIKAMVAKFWESIDANRPPAPDFRADAQFIAKMNGYAEPGKVLNAAGDTKIAGLARDYKEWGEKESSAKAEKQGIKAQILTLIEDAEKVVGDGFTISAGVRPPTLVEAYTREAYRDFRVYMKKDKSHGA